MERKRVEWVDIFKLLGILAIFCGHLGKGGEKLHDFVFCYHVPLFFFASGIFAGNLEGLRFKDAVIKRFRQIMVPYIFLVIINMIVIIITSDNDFITYLKYVKQFIWGIRNQMPASSLWFFSCIFCTGILFEVLRRLLKKSGLILLASAALYVISITLFPNNPGVQPSWIWNIDSACFYLIYYALGYALHTRLLAEPKAMDKKRAFFFMVGTALLAGYVLSIYLQEDVIAQFLYRIPRMDMIYPLLRTMLIIIFNLILAKILGSFHFLSYMGAQTLWLCGNEIVVKKLLNAAVEIIGLQIEITSPLSVIVYASIMAVVIIKVLMPIEKKLYQKYQQYLVQLGCG